MSRKEAARQVDQSYLREAQRLVTEFTIESRFLRAAIEIHRHYVTTERMGEIGNDEHPRHGEHMERIARTAIAMQSAARDEGGGSCGPCATDYYLDVFMQAITPSHRESTS